MIPLHLHGISNQNGISDWHSDGLTDMYLFFGSFGNSWLYFRRIKILNTNDLWNPHATFESMKAVLKKAPADVIHQSQYLWNQLVVMHEW